MFHTKYFLAFFIPLAVFVIYSIQLRQDSRIVAVTRSSSSNLQRISLRAVSQHVLTTDELASNFELFLVEKWCSVPCETNIVKELKTRFKCTEISVLPVLQSVQARCPVIRSMTPQQVEENVVQKITGMKGCVNNLKLPSASIGERVHVRTLSTRPPRQIKLKSVVSRFIQSISGMLPWGLDRIDQTTGEDGKFDLSCFPNLGKGVRIYVLDTGCRDTHEDLKGRTRIEKVGRYETGKDDHGHGTHVAGTAAGTNYGVCKRCDIVCVKTLDQDNVGTIIDVVDAVEYVLEQKKANPDVPAIAIMSLGGPLETNILDLAVNKLGEANVFAAVSAGNGFSDACEWTPPRAEQAITVGATMQNDDLRFSSNFGKCVKIVAPGDEVRSASHQGDSLYVTMSGTSMAAPYVAGVAGLILGEDHDLTPAQVLEKMKLNAKIVDDPLHESTYPLLRVLHQNCELYGFRALGALSSTSTPLPSGSPTPLLSASVMPVPSTSPSISTSSGSSMSPLSTPSMSPSSTPSTWPSATSSMSPSSTPSIWPSATPSMSPSSTPSTWPSFMPSVFPLSTPSTRPSSSPSIFPSSTPSMSPSLSPWTWSTSTPSVSLSSTMSPSSTPSTWPSSTPSISMSTSPTPSISASLMPSPSASFLPSPMPSMSHSPMPSISSSPVVTMTTTPSPTSSTYPALSSENPSPSVSFTPSISVSETLGGGDSGSSESPIASPSVFDSHSPSFSQTPVSSPSTHSSIITMTPSASTSQTILLSHSEESKPSTLDTPAISPTQDASNFASRTPSPSPLPSPSPSSAPDLLSSSEVSTFLTPSPEEIDMTTVTPVTTHSRSPSSSVTVSPEFSQDLMSSPPPTNDGFTPSPSRKPMVGGIGPSASASPYRFIADRIS